MDEDVIVARNIPVRGFIPGNLFAFVVFCLVLQYFLIACRAQFTVFVWFAIHYDRCDFAGLGVCDFPDRIFHLIRGASLCFNVSGFESHGGGGGSGRISGAVFVTDVFVLFLEVQHRGMNISRNESVAGMD